MPARKKQTAPTKKVSAKKKAPVKKKTPAKRQASKPIPPKSSPSPDLSQRQDELRVMLLGKRDSVIRNTREEISKYIKGEDRQLVESSLDDGDWSVIDLSEDLRLQKLGSNHDTVIKIDEALRKLKEGTYGICEDCGDEISAERLRILPFAIRCRDCQEDHEELLAAEKGESIVY